MTTTIGDSLAARLALLSDGELGMYWKAADEAVTQGERESRVALGGWFRVLRTAAEAEYSQRQGQPVPERSYCTDLCLAARRLAGDELVRLILAYQDGWKVHEGLPADHPATELAGVCFVCLDMEMARRASESPRVDAPMDA